MMTPEEADHSETGKAEFLVRGMKELTEKVGRVGMLERRLPVRARMIPVDAVTTIGALHAFQV